MSGGNREFCYKSQKMQLLKYLKLKTETLKYAPPFSQRFFSIFRGEFKINLNGRRHKSLRKYDI